MSSINHQTLGRWNTHQKPIFLIKEIIRYPHFSRTTLIDGEIDGKRWSRIPDANARVATKTSNTYWPEIALVVRAALNTGGPMRGIIDVWRGFGAIVGPSGNAAG